MCWFDSSPGHKKRAGKECEERLDSCSFFSSLSTVSRSPSTQNYSVFRAKFLCPSIYFTVAVSLLNSDFNSIKARLHVLIRKPRSVQESLSGESESSNCRQSRAQKKSGERVRRAPWNSRSFFPLFPLFLFPGMTFWFVFLAQFPGFIHISPA